MSLKISIITVVKNNQHGIAKAISSVDNQTYKNIEHIIVDGMSTDKTWEVISKSSSKKITAIQEIDSGIYDALNKGIKLASGKIVGILHSDDCFYDDQVLEDIKNKFENSNVDVVYGDLIYVSKNNPECVVRYWKSRDYRKNLLKNGWMPPHPTIFISSSLLNIVGQYDQRYKISADYKMIIKIFSQQRVMSSYIPRPLVRMRLGGASNKNLRALLDKTKEDYQILKDSEIGGIYTLFLKNLSKISQFFR